ncbi:putative Dual specificity protein phosphatase CDC14A, partial [Operophtera brumata]
MTQSPDILFFAEYIKNVLYFATVKTGKSLKNTNSTLYFSIDDELVYENYYSDFGPLNLGCVFKYCKILNKKLNQYLNKQVIVHYTTVDAKKKANSAFLLGCYGVLYLSLTPKDALKPILVQGQSYRPFQDATQSKSSNTISLIDCLQAIKKASDHGLFNFKDFNYEEYDRFDRIQGGDLNWIVPGKFLAFIGPVSLDYSVSLYHPPELYIDYFIENNVQIVIRLNKRLYDGNVFNNAGIVHYDLFFPDGSCPPRHILQKFLQIAESSEGAIAVHCKAGLGRTGSLIGSYLMKHYRMTAREAIGWMRICRPGSVIGHQQDWLEQLEAWLIKQGNLYRKRTYNDTEKFPIHRFGVYSIVEKTMKHRPVMFHKSPSPPPPANKV